MELSLCSAVSPDGTHGLPGDQLAKRSVGRVRRAEGRPPGLTCRVYRYGSHTQSPQPRYHPKWSWQMSMVFRYQASFQKKSST